VIESADPGYDWIFAQSIAGLITCYGGANSHMAVRCRELNIPAAIGVGVELFNSIKNSNLVYLDCANKKIEVHL
jgi:phosphoenolpyruvate-protein kinase (PTS system EI component)